MDGDRLLAALPEQHRRHEFMGFDAWLLGFYQQPRGAATQRLKTFYSHPSLLRRRTSRRRTMCSRVVAPPIAPLIVVGSSTTAIGRRERR